MKRALKFQLPRPKGSQWAQTTDLRQPVDSPFTVVVDSREKAPYRFEGLHTDYVHGGRRLRVRARWGHLPSGDYSVNGYEDRVAVERKSLGDLYGSLGRNRERFEREMERLAELDSAALVVEATWLEILQRPPENSRLAPKSVWRTSFAWMQRYGVPWICLPGRRLAEIATYRYLERWWRDNREHERVRDE